jgi:hypothetical protein
MRSLFHLGYGEIAITAWIMNALRSTFFGTARLASSLTHEATEGAVGSVPRLTNGSCRVPRRRLDNQVRDSANHVGSTGKSVFHECKLATARPDPVKRVGGGGASAHRH